MKLGPDGGPVTAGPLLAALVRAAETREDPGVLLHERVVLARLDGETLVGRAAVVDAVCTRDGGTSLTVITVETDAVRVALSLEGLEGALHFWIRGEARGGQLVVVSMEP